MNRKGNQRYAETKEKIEGIFSDLLKKRDISEITVSEICRRAGIHRTTFYGHYEDIYDLMAKMIADLYVEIMDQFLPEGKMDETTSECDTEDAGAALSGSGTNKMRLGHGFCQLFVLVGENKNLLLAYMAECEKKGVVFELLPELLEEHMLDVMRKMNYSSREELNYHHAFFCAGLKAMLKAWLQRGCVESPEEMSRILAHEYAPDKGRLFSSPDAGSSGMDLAV